jgi:single-strand DNA-binding protein
MADYGSLNKVILIGRISTEIKSKDSKKGTAICWFNLATNELYREEEKPRAYFNRVVCFGQKAKMMVEYGTMGRLIAIEGKLHNRSWQGEDGQRHSMTEVAAESIVFLTAAKEKDKTQAPKEQEEKTPDWVEEEGERLEEKERQPREDDPFA